MNILILMECKCQLHVAVKSPRINGGLECLSMSSESLLAAARLCEEFPTHPVHFVETGARWHLVPFDKVTDTNLTIDLDLLRAQCGGW